MRGMLRGICRMQRGDRIAELYDFTHTQVKSAATAYLDGTGA